MDAVIYCRVSTPQQLPLLKEQEQRCRYYAQQQSYRVTKVFTDHCSTGPIADM